MKHLPFFIFMLLAVSAALGQGVPQTMSYQGYLTDLTGSPVSDGAYRFTFSIYVDEAGGAPLWTEVHPSVQVAEGLFTVILGRGNPANPLTPVFDRQYYLGITVGTDPELSPRVRLTTSAYSMRARMAESVLDGAITTAKMADDAVTGAKIANGAVGTPQIADGAVVASKIPNNVITADHLSTPIVSSINSVTNDGGNINLVAGGNVTITPDDAANTITISASGGGGGLTLPYSGTANSASDAFAVTNSGAGNAGMFQSNSGATATKTLEVYSASTHLSSSALFAHSTAGAAVEARAGGTSPAGYFQNTGTGNCVNLVSTNAGDGLFINKSGAGNGINMIYGGSGKGIFIDNNAASPGLEIQQDGNSNAAYFHIENTSAAYNCLRAVTNSTNINSDALEAKATTGNALDAVNNSGSAPTLVARNNSADAASQALYLQSGGLAGTIEVHNINSSPNGFQFEGWAGGTQTFRMYNSGNFYTHGGLYSSHALLRDALGGSSGPQIGGVYKDNTVLAWARMSGASITTDFGVASVGSSVVNGFTTYTVTLNNSAADANSLVPVVTTYDAPSTTPSPDFATVHSVTANSFKVTIYSWNNTTKTWDSGSGTWYFVVLGRP